MVTTRGASSQPQARKEKGSKPAQAPRTASKRKGEAQSDDVPSSAGTSPAAKKQRSAAVEADHARAVIASVDTGEDPKQMQQRCSKQSGLKVEHGGSDGGSGDGSERSADRAASPAPGEGATGSGGRGAVDTGQDPQETLQRATHQTGLKASVGGGKGAAGSEGVGSAGTADGNGNSERKDVTLDKAEHKLAPARDGRKNQEVQAAREDAAGKDRRVISINRAPTLTLWVTAVAQREGFNEESALSFGKAISGMLAQSKGRRLGVFQAKDQDAPRPGAADSEKAAVFGMNIKVTQHDGRTVARDADGKAVNPGQVRGYLKRAFGDDLPAAEEALAALAAAHAPEDIGGRAYHLYEQFRPDAGWGQKGELDLTFIEAMAERVGS